MKPILFAENSTTFNTNGIGRLSDALSCKVTEQRNGIYEVEMVYPMHGVHYEDIALRKIVVVKPSANATLQPFRIYKISKPINGKVTIYGQHISYDLSKNVCMPFSVSASGTACNTALQGLKTNAVETCPFTFWTDVTTVASYAQKTPASIKQRMGGVSGSILDQFGGEYEYDVYTVKLHRERGTERDITYRYGKNITTLEQEENIANTVTGVVPYWIDYEGNTVTLPEKAVYSTHAGDYSQNMTIPLDLSQEWENAPTQAGLRAAAVAYINQNGIGVPKVSTEVSFVNLADTEEYKNILPLQNVNLCDVITVQFERLGISTTAKIVETVYDVLEEKYISVQIGSLRSNLTATITDIESSGAQAINDTGKRVFAEANSKAQDLVNNATGWLTSADGFVIAVKDNDGTWKELIFADDKDPADWHNLLRINENGIGFSSDGGNTYTQAWTLDGRLVIGGTNVPSITVYDNSNNILFQAGIFEVSNVLRSWVIWNAQNSSMDETGRITANNADINGTVSTIRTYTRNNVQHTQKASLTSGELAFEHDGTVITSLSANYDGRVVSFDIDSQSVMNIISSSLSITGDGGIYMQTENGESRITADSRYLDIYCEEGDITIENGGGYNIILQTSGDIIVNDTNNDHTGYTGYISPSTGVNYVKGICIGPAT